MAKKKTTKKTVAKKTAPKKTVKKAVKKTTAKKTTKASVPAKTNKKTTKKVVPAKTTKKVIKKSEVKKVEPVQKVKPIKTYDDKKPIGGLGKTAKIFLLIRIIIGYVFIIPIAWILPMHIYYSKHITRRIKISTGYKVCVLLFIDLVAGILMLCDHEN